MNLRTKDVPAELRRRLEAQADAHKRSHDWKAIDILERALHGLPLTEDLLREAGGCGRA
jgi:plasmid stability protein